MHKSLTRPAWLIRLPGLPILSFPCDASVMIPVLSYDYDDIWEDDFQYALDWDLLPGEIHMK